jgi:tRNA(adenine34) deaminase
MMEDNQIINQHFMHLALKEAIKAQRAGEVPVGAIMVDGHNQILSRGRNRTIGSNDPSAHAELVAIRRASRKIGNYRLLSTTLYVTIEPCIMCMGAIIHARIGRLVFGAHDPKWGAVGSLYDFAKDQRMNHCPMVISGVCEDACKAIIQGFFRMKRGGSKGGS